MITLRRFRRIEATLREAGYGAAIDWSETIPTPADADAFAAEAIYVIINSGFKNAIAKPIFDRCIAALRAGLSSATEFGHPGKQSAIDQIWSDRAEIFTAYQANPDKLAYLGSLPWVGPVTRFHLEKNLGGGYAKPDVHLERLARREMTDTHKLCARLARETGYRVATIDTVLWRACADGLLNSKTYEKEGWKAAFRPEQFLAENAGSQGASQS